MVVWVFEESFHFMQVVSVVAIHSLVTHLMSVGSVVIFHFIPVIVICVSFFLMSVLLEVCQFYRSFKESACWPFKTFFLFFFLNFIHFCSIIFYLLWDYFAVFFLVSSHVSLDYLTLFLFSVVQIYAINFPFSRVFNCLPQILTLCFHFYSVQCVIWFQSRLVYLMDCLEVCCIVFQVLGDFSPVLLISNCIPLWFENMCYMIYILINLWIFGFFCAGFGLF